MNLLRLVGTDSTPSLTFSEMNRDAVESVPTRFMGAMRVNVLRGNSFAGAADSPPCLTALFKLRYGSA